MWIENSRDLLFTSAKGITSVCYQGNVFDSNCVEIGVEAVKMDWVDGKFQNNIKLISIKKSRDEWLTFEKGNTNVYVT